MALAPGDRLGPYAIVSRIGAGGMGEVWKARDTRLDRTVAIKTSSTQFSDRFEREARAIAALNHPNVCQLYDVGPDYLVMEYIEGKPLAGPLPQAEALRLAMQIADALAAAHRRGIVHRDLKPGNILLTKTGVKVLDFGLARIEASGTGPGGDESLTQALTQQGAILGTLQYMAPEQLQGQPADARADIFSFGCVLYEMLSGKRAFDGASQASVIAAILERRPPNVSGVRDLDWVLGRCFEKDPDDRWQSMADVKAELGRIASMPESASGKPVTAESRRGRVVWAVAGGGLVAMLAAALSLFRPAAPHAARVEFQERPPANMSFVDSPALSPDGLRIAYLATADPDVEGKRRDKRNGIWVRNLDASRGQALAGTENAETFFWSPDGKSIAFVAGRQLKRTDLTGGSPQLLAALPGAADSIGTWSSRGVIVVPVESQGLYAVPAGGGEARRLTRLADRDTDHFSPVFLPGGDRLLFCGFGEHPGVFSIAANATDNTPPTLVAGGNCGGVSYADPGYLIVMRNGALVAQAFDSKTLRLSGDPFPAVDQSFTAGWFWKAQFTAAAGGLVLYDWQITGAELHWVDRAGNDLGTIKTGDEKGGAIDTMALSPDGKRLAASRQDPATGNIDIWVLDLARQAWSRISVDPAVEHNAVWSPDGKRLVYESHRDSSLALYQKEVDGGAPDRKLVTLNRSNATCDWSRDGDILYSVEGPETRSDLWIASADGGQQPYPLIQTRFADTCGQFSPDGRFLVYSSDEAGIPQVYARPLSRGANGRLEVGADRWQVSANSGVHPRWGPEGREIYFLSTDGEIVTVAVKASGRGLELGKPVSFRAPVRSTPFTMPYAPAPDGKRFLLVEQGVANLNQPARVILNWSAGPRR